jgi:hypothetical protein
MNQGPRWTRLVKKAGGRKSRATIPLFSNTEELYINSYHERIYFLRIHFGPTICTVQIVYPLRTTSRTYVSTYTAGTYRHRFIKLVKATSGTA